MHTLAHEAAKQKAPLLGIELLRERWVGWPRLHVGPSMRPHQGQVAEVHCSHVSLRQHGQVDRPGRLLLGCAWLGWWQGEDEDCLRLCHLKGGGGGAGYEIDVGYTP